MEKPDLAIIENTFAGRKEFGLGCWHEERNLTGEQINELLNGKCLAVSVDGGVFFITRFDGEKKEAKRTDEVNSLRAEVIALKQANNDRQELLESISGKNKELKDALDAAKALYEKVVRDRDTAQADLAQMKSTLSDTQQKLRAVQEDRDEFAEKMNDAVERADQLQARCGDLEQDVTRLKARNRELLDERLKLNGQIDAFSFVIEHWRGGGT